MVQLFRPERLDHVTDRVATLFDPLECRLRVAISSLAFIVDQFNLDVFVACLMRSRLRLLVQKQL